MASLPPLPALAVLALLAAPLVAGAGDLQAPPQPAVGATVPCTAAVLCPDLAIDAERIRASFGNINYAPSHCAVQEGMAPPGPQRIVRFTTSIPNYGAGHLVIGSPSANPERFVWSDCHRHYHTREYADYRVWKPDAYPVWAALRAASGPTPSSELLQQLPPEMQPVRGGKQGFCVLDVSNYIPGMPRGGFGCGNMGISSGWADVYGSGITGQWVVITGLAAGEYVLELEVNAERFFQELDYVNNSGFVRIQVT